MGWCARRACQNDLSVDSVAAIEGGGEERERKGEDRRKNRGTILSIFRCMRVWIPPSLPYHTRPCFVPGVSCAGGDRPRAAHSSGVIVSGSGGTPAPLEHKSSSQGCL
jgi:hypothetical protein